MNVKAWKFFYGVVISVGYRNYIFFPLFFFFFFFFLGMGGINVWPLGRILYLGFSSLKNILLYISQNLGV